VAGASRGIAAAGEVRGAATLTGGCNPSSIFIEGVPMTAPGTVSPNLPLGDIERVEAISPGQAGVQYGTRGGAGVLLIETRQGPRADQPRDVRESLVGFQWEGEPRPYAWPRVIGGTFLANAVGVGLGLLVARQCLGLTDNGLLGVQDNCGGIAAFAAGAAAVGLPVSATSYVAHWGGATSRSQGRIIPTAVVSSVAAMTGYLLVIEGNEMAGGVFLVA